MSEGSPDTYLVNTCFISGTKLQYAWDSTTLGMIKECARKYYYSQIMGYAPRQESFHLTFGILFHGALERYDHRVFDGATHEEAVDFVVDWCLKQTWNKELRRPWDSGDSNKNRLTLVRTVVWYMDQFQHDSLPNRPIVKWQARS